MQSVGITGATGFVGKQLSATLEKTGYDVTRIIRGTEPHCESGNYAVVGQMDGCTDWTEVIKGHNCLIHLAARVHVMAEVSVESRNEYRLINVDSTLNLAKQAAAAGVKRFIYMSSIKVNGETTYENPFRPDDEPEPCDLYGQSKREAEIGLKAISEKTGLEVVIIRPPLVYGPEVKANFLKLLMWAQKGWPLPFGAVSNKRSFVYLDNLIDFISACISHPAAAGETFLVSDGVDMSTADLVKIMCLYMDRSARLLSVPIWLLKTLGGTLGRKAEIERICGSLQVDISKAENLLDWKPPISVDKGMEKTVAWFMRNV